MNLLAPLVLTVLMGVLSLGSVIHAAEDTPGGGNEFLEGIKKAEGVALDSGLSIKQDIIPVIASVIQWLLALSAVLAMGAIVWGGIMYITSLGDEGRAGKAKTIIWYAVIGVIVILLSFVIISFIKTELTKVGYAPWGILTAHAAATDTSSGFNSGITAITELIKPGDSGLATDTNIFPVIIRIVKLLLGLVAVLALVALVWASIMYILSLGDEGKTEKAKKIILYAIIGVLLSGFSFVILSALQGLITG